MARPLVVEYGGEQIPLDLHKVERSDLYGSVEIETYDDEGKRCTVATLAQDGKTIVTTGGSAFGCVNQDGSWLDRSTLTPVDMEGAPLQPYASSFAEPVTLSLTATIEEYLDHNIRTVYQIDSDADLAPLRAELSAGTIFTFPFSYRGGLAPDQGFLLESADGGLFFLVGSANRVEFTGIGQPDVIEDDEESSDDDDTLDFAMM